MEMIATLTPGCGGEPLESLARPPEGVGVVELRADLFPGLDPGAAAAACPLPLMYTLRSTAEGGRGPGDPVTREPLLRRAWESGCAFVDLEAERDGQLLSGGGLDPQRVVLSWHDPQGTPEDLEDRTATLLATRARWVKVVPAARSLADLQRVLALHQRFNRAVPARRRLLAFAMGPAGQASRFLAPLLGPPMTYVAWDASAPAAPGQITAADLVAAVGHLPGPPRRLFGVVGRDVTGSRSPRLHGAAFAALGLPWALLPFSVPEAPELELLFRPQGETILDQLALSTGGWAVTAPYKENAAEAATVAAPRVRRARSANTLLLRPGQILADTTDADGIVGALKAAGMDPCGLEVVIQGTGGAARAAAVGLDLAGATVFLRGRDAPRTHRVAELIGVTALPPGQLPPGRPILVNGTPLGSRSGEPSPFPPEEVAHAAAVVDMVYGPGASLMQSAAEEARVPYVGGLSVLLHQGIAQIAAFTGKIPPRDVLTRALESNPVA